MAFVELHLIHPGLYLGSQKAVADGYLQAYRITHIVNVTADGKLPNERYIPRSRVIRLAEDDMSGSNLKQYFEMSNAFIENAINMGGNVLVHCQMGVSRSTTIVAAYLMKKLDISAQQALHYISRERPQINPNAGFRQQLLDYERELRNAW
jgi:protein-tyrosine phosphatase